MHKAVFKRFPSHTEAIKSLLQKSSSFREICADYEEICATVAKYSDTVDPASEKFMRDWEMKKDLEGEIIGVLKEAGI